MNRVWPQGAGHNRRFLEMNTLKINKTVAAVWLAITLLIGGGLVAPAVGIEIVSQTHACGLDAGSGGGC